MLVRISLGTALLGGCTSQAGSPAAAPRRPAAAPSPLALSPLTEGDVRMLIAVAAAVAAEERGRLEAIREHGRLLGQGLPLSPTPTPSPTSASPGSRLETAVRSLGYQPALYRAARARFAQVVLERQERREREAIARLRAAHLAGLKRAQEGAASEDEKARLAAAVAEVEADAARDLASTAAGPGSVSAAERALVERFAADLGLTPDARATPPPEETAADPAAANGDRPGESDAADTPEPGDASSPPPRPPA